MDLKEFINYRLFNFPVFSVFEPASPDYNYICRNSDVGSFCDINYEDFIKNNYDIFPQLYKEILGKDQSGKYNIYNYTYKSRNSKSKVCLTAGMHGIELGGILGLSWFIWNVFNTQESGFKYIRENVDISFIPVLNPWGLSQSPLNYGNCNQVNINKNIKYHGINSIQQTSRIKMNGWDYPGDLDNPEQETRILLDWIGRYSHYDLYIDCHTAVYRPLTNRYSPEESTLFYNYCSPGIIDIVNNSNKLILDFYKLNYTIDKVGGSRLIDETTVKNMLFYNKYNINTLSIEQIMNYDELDWGGGNGDNNAVKNYVLMMRMYVLSILRININIKKYEKIKTNN